MPAKTRQMAVCSSAVMPSMPMAARSWANATEAFCFSSGCRWKEMGREMSLPLPEHPRHWGQGDIGIHGRGGMPKAYKSHVASKEKAIRDPRNSLTAAGEAPARFLESLVLGASLGTSSPCTTLHNSHLRSLYRC